MSFDLSANFAGLKLDSPIVVGSCPLSAEQLQRIAWVSNGTGAIVLPSLFQEHLTKIPTESQNIQTDLSRYLRLVESATSQGSGAIIGSVNGCIATDWTSTVKQIESAGAKAIELSIRPDLSLSPLDPRTLEDSVVETVLQTKSAIGIPLIVKLTRNFTSVSNLASRLQPHIDGITLYGRAPIVDIELECLEPARKWNITESGTILSALEPIMQIRHQFPDLSIAACGGIGSSIDLIKSLLSGANVAMVTSAIYRDGASIIGSLRTGLIHFMEKHEMESLDDLGPHALGCLEEEIGFWQSDAAVVAMHPSHEIRSPAFTCDRHGHASVKEE